MKLWETQVAEPSEASVGAVALDAGLRIIGVSDGILRRSGFERSQMIGVHAVELLHPDDVPRGIEVLDEVQAIPGDRADGMYRLRTSSGAYRYFTIRASNLGPDEQNVIVLEFREATKDMRALALADDAVDAMRMLSEDITFEESVDWVSKIAERHVEGLCLVVTMFGADGQNQIYCRDVIPDELRLANESARPDALPVHVEVAHEQMRRRRWRASHKIASFDFVMPGRLTSILVDRQDRLVGYVEAIRDTTEVPDEAEWLVHGMISRMMTAVVHRFDFDRQLRDAAELDSLTGLLNRRKLFEALNTDGDLAGSLLYLIDLDRFSWVNNNLGHKAGDETLVGVAQALRAACPPDSMIARLGGDEFVVWIPAARASHELETLGGQISKAMVVPAGVGDNRVAIRASIGMVRIAPGEIAADALNRADLAMYSSKRAGGDCATVG